METNLNEKTDTHANDTCTCHSHSACGCGCHCHEEKGNSIRDFVMPALSFCLLIAGIIMNHTGTSWFAAQSVKLIWFLVAFLPVGLPVIQEAWEAVREKDFFSEFTLMLIASIGAFCIGEYPEAVAVMLFYTIGETLQHRAVDKASRNISRLLDVRPERTSVLRNGNYTDISPKEVRTGELIEIKPGERIPLDGVLTEEEATFDTSALTGESMPRTIAKGGEVFLLDEPEAGIDLWSFEDLVKVFEKLHDKTVIIVSHQQRILETADKIVLFDNDKLICAGKREEMFSRLMKQPSLCWRNVKES